MTLRAMNNKEDADCPTCGDSGGVFDDETIDGEGLPNFYPCPDCELKRLYAFDNFERSFVTGRSKDGL